MRPSATCFLQLSVTLFIAIPNTAPARSQPPKETEWARVIEDERAIKIETDKLEAVIRKEMIEEIHGQPVKAGESFSAAHIVGYFDSIEEMHEVYDKYKTHTALTADASGWQLKK